MRLPATPAVTREELLATAVPRAGVRPMPGLTHDSAAEGHSASPPRVTQLPTYHRPLLPSLLQTTQLNKSRELLYGRYKVTLINSWHVNPKTHHRAKDQGAEPALLMSDKGTRDHTDHPGGKSFRTGRRNEPTSVLVSQETCFEAKSLFVTNTLIPYSERDGRH